MSDNNEPPKTTRFSDPIFIGTWIAVYPGIILTGTYKGREAVTQKAFYEDGTIEVVEPANKK